MSLSCPFCETRADYVVDFRTIVRHGVYRRTSDSKAIERYRCRLCQKTFSQATKDPCFRQKKRHKNKRIGELLASGATQRRIARLERLNRKTVDAKVRFLGARASFELSVQTAFLRVDELQIDDLETHEHSKYQPVSVTCAVTADRRILGFRVARMPARGLISRKARKRYGFRKDERQSRRIDLLNEIAPVVREGAIVRTDSNPHYVPDLARYLPQARHIAVPGGRASTSGQGELKQQIFDPIFALNHTFAMFRANVSMLIRKTWSTAKKAEGLENRIAIYSVYHNAHL